MDRIKKENHHLNMMAMSNDDGLITPEDATAVAAVAAANSAVTQDQLQHHYMQQAAAAAAVPQASHHHGHGHQMQPQMQPQMQHQMQHQIQHQPHGMHQQPHPHHQHHQFQPPAGMHNQFGAPDLGHQVNPHHLNHHLEMLAHVKDEDLLEPNNRKVAPRASDLFRVGPSFSETRHHQDIYCKKNDMAVNPILDARIDRGFEMGEQGTWIGYKRNYFTLVASFNLEGFDYHRFIQNKFYTYEKSKNPAAVGENKVEIGYFAIRLVAKCSDDDVNISLVQHTAKRDKGPQFPPPIYPAVPGDLPDHDTIRASSNKRNGAKIDNLNKVFYFDRAEYYQNMNLDALKDDSVLKNYPSDSIARVARFERIQFTSSIRMKTTSVNTRFFTLHVELLGIIEDEDSQIQPILLSSIESPPLVIRGRSPSNYHKDRTSGYRARMQLE